MPSCPCDHSDVFFFLFPNTVWTLDEIRHCQMLSDLLISLAFFSIPLEFLYFFASSSSSSPPPLFLHRRSLIHFAAFVILCGLTHLVDAHALSTPSYKLAVTLTLLKFATAMVACAASISLAKLIPRMLRATVREVLLAKKTGNLVREIGMLRRQEEASWLVLMLSQEIRNSLDRHTVLETCVVGLSKAFSLQDCAIWLPDERNSVMILSHETGRRSYERAPVPINDPDMAEILGRKGISFPRLNSKLGNGEAPAMAIRLPISRWANFGGSRAAKEAEPCFGALVLVGDRIWTSVELGIVEEVVDEVAVALSQSAIIEDSLLIKEKLIDRNIALKRANNLAMNACEAMRSFWGMMSEEIIRSSRSIAAISSVLEVEDWVSEEQRSTVGSVTKLGLLLSGLVENVNGDLGLGESVIELKPHPFSLPSMLKEIARVSKLMCAIRGLNFDIWVHGKVPEQVIGDEMRIIQAILSMVVKMMEFEEYSTIVLSVVVGDGSHGISDTNYVTWKYYASEGPILLKFDIYGGNLGKDFRGLLQRNFDNNRFGDRNPKIDFSICEKLAKLMHGTASTGHNSEDLDEWTLKFRIRLPVHHSRGGLVHQEFVDPGGCLLKGMKAILVDRNGFHHGVTRKLLENMGCQLTKLSSFRQCVEMLCSSKNYYQLLLIDLDISEEDDGCELIAQIQKLRLDSWIRIVALTKSRLDRGARDWCARCGIHGVIRKPVILQEMEDELQRVFQPPSPLYTRTEKV